MVRRRPELADDLLAGSPLINHGLRAAAPGFQHGHAEGLLRAGVQKYVDGCIGFRQLLNTVGTGQPQNSRREGLNLLCAQTDQHDGIFFVQQVMKRQKVPQPLALVPDAGNAQQDDFIFQTVLFPEIAGVGLKISRFTVLYTTFTG